MAYIGQAPTNAPLTSSDIQDGIIVAADLAPNSVDSSELVDGSIDTSHIGDDQVTADKLANSINTDIATGVTAGTVSAAALPKAGGDMTGTVNFGSDGSGQDVYLYGNTAQSGTTGGYDLAGGYAHWDESADKLRFGQSTSIHIGYPNASSVYGSEAARVTINVPTKGTYNNSDLSFSTAWNDWSGDCLHIINQEDTGSDIGSVGGNITFGAPASAGRNAAIACIRDGGDNNNLGLAFWVHPSNSYTGALTKSFWIGYNGDIGGVHGPDYHVSSDERMKTNIVTIPDALTKVCSLRGVHFNWKPEFEPTDNSASSNIPKGQKLNAGFIAQEVETIIPEVINTQKPYEDTGVDEDGVAMNDGVDGKKAVKDGNQLSAYLVEAIKELVTRVEALENA